MNWKTDLKLADLDVATRLEATCKRCGLTRYEQAAALMRREKLTQAYLDEVEARLALLEQILPWSCAPRPHP